DSAGLLNLAPAWWLSTWVAPVGLSFYTLARMTHTLDVYYRFERPSRSFLEFLTFTSFFPLLVSGPIERSSRILPVLARRRRVDADGIYRGAWLILLGLFQKVVIADHCGALVGTFLRPHPGTVLTVLGVAAYSMQIFADFSGYSDIARGVARLLGIDVMENFRAPYLSRNLPEYWRRWHISLSSWLEDYVYKPTGMWLRNFGLLGAFGATALTFFISAIWHGRGWTFLCWGAVHVAGITAFMATRGFRKRLKARLPAAPLELFSTVLTFATVCLAYVFFRAPDVSSALSTLAELSRPLPLNLPDLDDGLEFLTLAIAVAGVHHIQVREDADWVQTRPLWQRASCYAAMLFLIVRVPGSSQAFIYFQF
ncbi:MAG TPA: MBOAT family O-acyltransferase, partial [Polyangiaceae bacterium]